MTIQFITDGGADIPQELIEKGDIMIVPLYLRFGTEQFQPGIDLSIQAFYERMKHIKHLPKSAAPSPNDYYETYKKVDSNTPIINLCISKSLSSTYENALIARDMLLEEEPNRKITVINTKTASCGMALFIHQALEKVDTGYSFDEVSDYLRQLPQHTATLFALKTLNNVIKGGRLDKVRGRVAKTLNIKLLMRGSDEGAIEVTEKVRGDKKSIRRFIEQIGEYAKTFEEKVLFMSHYDSEQRARQILNEMMKTYPFKKSYLVEMDPLIAIYAGEGGIVISFSHP